MIRASFAARQGYKRATQAVSAHKQNVPVRSGLQRNKSTTARSTGRRRLISRSTVEDRVLCPTSTDNKVPNKHTVTGRPCLVSTCVSLQPCQVKGADKNDGRHPPDASKILGTDWAMELKTIRKYICQQCVNSPTVDRSIRKMRAAIHRT